MITWKLHCLSILSHKMIWDAIHMNSQLVGTHICIDIWEVLSNRPSVLPTKRRPIYRNLEAPQPLESQACLITAILQILQKSVPKN